MANPSKKLAVFDFDKTISIENSDDFFWGAIKQDIP